MQEKNPSWKSEITFFLYKSNPSLNENYLPTKDGHFPSFRCTKMEPLRELISTRCPIVRAGGELNCWIVVPEDTTLSHYCLIYSPSSSSPRRHSVRCSKSRPQHTTALLAVTFVKQVFLFDLSQDVCLLRCRLSGGNIFQSEPNWKHLSIFVLFWIGDNGWRLSKRVVWSTNYLVWLSVVWLTKTPWIFFTHLGISNVGHSNRTYLLSLRSTFQFYMKQHFPLGAVNGVPKMYLTAYWTALNSQII